ncbi:hypothetical protein FH972_011831 [Carpinus fangiana]|uniref:F-box domain-containing protein n=1 Tax=Carpinus fangiana TaxID=176857 RepID=A0A660KYK2_9ROSI|nr:hypothetical protein FH972_011831 [Carpinus fangiana]
MERPRTKQINCGGGGDDRFSDLPDEVVYDILCLLKMRDHARLMVVSKRCRELCISNPNLDLNNIVKKSSLSCLNNFVDRLINQRCGHGVKTERLHLCWSFEGSVDEDQERRRVNTWLQDLGDVAKVYLRFIQCSHRLLDPDQPALALALPLCNSTSSVVVDAGDAFLILPSSPSSYLATKLKILILYSVRIQKECNFGELLSSFKSLETLKLNEISGIKRMSLSSSTSNIEILSIASRGPDHICDIEIQQLHKLRDLDLVLFGTTNERLINEFGRRAFIYDGRLAISKPRVYSSTKTSNCGAF